MKLKNTRELRLRAEAHARHDRVKQGTYGDVTKNGKLNYEGCAIGCLSTPHRADKMQEYLVIHSAWGVSRREQVSDLANEFGMCEMLVDAIEDIFEGLPTHGAAVEFVPAVARALERAGDGTDVAPEDVRRFWGTQYDTIGNTVVDLEVNFLRFLRGLGSR